MNRNRNWYAAPLQGSGRSAHDYGHSGPIQSDFGDQAWYRTGLMLACVGVFALVVIGLAA